MNKIKITRFFFITLFLCLCLVSFLLPGVKTAVFGEIPSGVLDSTSDTSITNGETAAKYLLDIAGKKQDFIITGVYGPSPCTPIGEGGSAFYAISINPVSSSFDRYVYSPKIVSYRIEFSDYMGNVLKTVSGTKEVEYNKTGSNRKKIVGWLYGFYKPNEFKNKLGELRFKMEYRIWFVNDASNALQFDLLANKIMPSAKKTADKLLSRSDRSRPVTAAKEKHRLISSRAGAIEALPGSALNNISLAPAELMTQVGFGITPRAGGGVTAGYGVDMISGALTDDAVDISLPGGMSIARHYNSGMGYQPGRCFGWMFNFEEFLRFDPDGSIFYRQYDFREYRFMPAAGSANNYTPAKPGNFLGLKQDAQGNFEITFKNQTKKVFDPNGRMIKTADSAGNAVTYAWEPPGSRQRGAYDVPLELVRIMGPADIMRANQILKITDPYGRSIRVTFNPLGRVGEISDWSGRYVQYVWDGIQGIYLLKFRNTGGNYIEYAYAANAYNQLKGVQYSKGIKINNYYLSGSSPNSQVVSYQTDYNGAKTAYNYGWLTGNQNRWTTVSIAGALTTYYYDENGSVTKVVKPGANNQDAAFTFTYYADKNLLKSVTNPLGRVTSYVYDERGNTVETKFPDGKIVKRAYDANTDNLTDYWDTRGRRTSFNYDGKNNLISIDETDGSKVSFVYDDRGRPVKTTDENGHGVTYAYGAYGDLVKIADEEGGALTYYRDSLGRTVAIEANGSKTIFVYDSLDRITRIADSLGRSANISYDGNGNVISAVNQLGYTDKFEYDALDRLIYITDPEGAVQPRSYTARGMLTQIISPRGGSINFYYNNADYLTSLVGQFYTSRTFYDYDANGNLVKSSNPYAGKTVEFRYDEMNRLIQKIADNNAYYEYNESGNVKRVRDNSGETLYEYDAMDRLVKKTFPFCGAEFLRRFDKAGNVVYEKQINGDEFYYEYDKANKLLSAAKKGGGALLYKYNQGQDLAMIEYPNGITEYIAYNESKNAVRMKYILSKTGVVVYEVNYEYDELNRIISKRESNSQDVGKKISYAYDKNGRLKEVRSDGALISEYAYDKNGNRGLSRTLNGTTTYSYDIPGRLLKAGKASYSYDYANNLTSETDSIAGETKTYQYDKESNLKSIKKSAANKKDSLIFYDYGADNLRISRTSPENPDKTFACWFGGQILGEIKSNGQVEFINYGYGFKNKTGDYYYITDIQGSVVGLTDKNGGIVAVYKYDEFGNPITTIETTGAQGSPSPTPTASASAAPVPVPSVSATPQTPQVKPTPSVSVSESPEMPAKPQTPQKKPDKDEETVKPPSTPARDKITSSPAAPAPQKQGSASAGGASAGGRSSGGTSGGGTSIGGTPVSSTPQTQKPYNENILGKPTPKPEEIKTPGAGTPAPQQTAKSEKAKPALKQENLRPIPQAPVPQTPSTPQVDGSKIKKPVAKPTASPTTFSPTPSSTLPYTPMPSQQQYQITPAPAGSITPAPSTDAGARRAAPEPKQGMIKRVIDTIVNFFKNLFGGSKASVFDLINNLFGGGASGGGQSNKIESPIRFAGYYYDKDTGLYYVQSRYYDPKIGRFNQADKISYAGGLNLYAYCDNDPINYIDPRGFEGISGVTSWVFPRIVKKIEQETAEQGEKEVLEQGGWIVKKATGAGGGMGRGGQNLSQDEMYRYLTARQQGGILPNAPGKRNSVFFLPPIAQENKISDYFNSTDAGKIWNIYKKASDIVSIVAGPEISLPLDIANKYVESEIVKIENQYQELLRKSNNNSGSGSGTGSGAGGIDTGGTAVDFDPSALTLKISPSSVKVPYQGAPGRVNIEIKLADNQGKPISGAQVSLKSDKSGGFSTAAPVTDSNGYAMLYYESTEGRTGSVVHTITASYKDLTTSKGILFSPSPCTSGVRANACQTYCSPGSSLSPTSVGPGGIVTLHFSICRRCGIACTNTGMVDLLDGAIDNIDQYSADGGPWKPIDQLRSEVFRGPNESSTQETHWHTVRFKIASYATQRCGNANSGNTTNAYPGVRLWTAGVSYFYFEILGK